jgi:hypothetical protein
VQKNSEFSFEIKVFSVLEKLNCPRATVPEKAGFKYATHAGAGARRGCLARLHLV